MTGRRVGRYPTASRVPAFTRDWSRLMKDAIGLKLPKAMQAARMNWRMIGMSSLRTRRYMVSRPRLPI